MTGRSTHDLTLDHHGAFTEPPWVDQTATPSGVLSGEHVLYATTSGFYSVDSGGTVLGPFGTTSGGGMTNPMTTAGDTIVGGASGTPQRLPIGTAGQVYTVVSGAPAWASAASASLAPVIAFNLTNKSGGAVTSGDVVILDSSNDEAFTTTTTASGGIQVGIAQESIASNGVGLVAFSGYVPLVNVAATVSRGDYAYTATTVKQATNSPTYVSGAFGTYLKAGTAPSAYLFGLTLPTDVLTKP